MKFVSTLQLCRNLIWGYLSKTYVAFLLRIILLIFDKVLIILFWQASYSVRNVVIPTYPPIMVHNVEVGIRISFLLCLQNQITNSIEYFNTIILEPIFNKIILVIFYDLIRHIYSIKLLNLIFYLRVVGEIIKIGL